MKNQNDLIIRIVMIVLAVIACGVIIFNKPSAYAPASPEKVPVVNLQLPAGTVVKTKGLPGGGDQPGGGGGGGALSPSPAPGGGGAAPARQRPGFEGRSS